MIGAMDLGLGLELNNDCISFFRQRLKRRRTEGVHVQLQCYFIKN